MTRTQRIVVHRRQRLVMDRALARVTRSPWARRRLPGQILPPVMMDRAHMAEQTARYQREEDEKKAAMDALFEKCAEMVPPELVTLWRKAFGL